MIIFIGYISSERNVVFLAMFSKKQFKGKSKDYYIDIFLKTNFFLFSSIKVFVAIYFVKVNIFY